MTGRLTFISIAIAALLAGCAGAGRDTGPASMSAGVQGDASPERASRRDRAIIQRDDKGRQTLVGRF